MMDRAADFAPAGAIFVAGALYFAAGGLGFTWDSERYLYFATQMALNGDFSTYIVYAPLYPALLSTLMRAGLDFLWSTSLIAASSLATIAYFIGIGLRAAGASRPIMVSGAVLAGAIAFAQTPFLWIWTEQMYSAIIVAVSVLVAIHLTKGSRAMPWGIIALAAVLPTARYIGTFPLALLLGTILLTYLARNGWRASTISTAVFGGILGSAGFLGIAAHHLTAGKCIFGCRPPSDHGLFDNMVLTAEVLASDLWLYAGVFAAAMIFIDFRGRQVGTPALVLIPLAVLAIGVAGQIYSSTAARIDPINNRYFAPYYPLVVLAGLIVLVRMAGDNRARLARAMPLAACLISILIAVGLFSTRGLQRWTASLSGEAPLTGQFAPVNVGLGSYLAAISEADRIAYVMRRFSSQNAAAMAFNPQLLPAGCRVVDLDPTPSDRRAEIVGLLSCAGGDRVVRILLASELAGLPSDLDAVVVANSGEYDPTGYATEQGYRVAVELIDLVVLSPTRASQL